MKRTVINQKNIDKWKKYLAELSENRDKWLESYDNEHWLNTYATLEVSLGQIAESFLKTITIIGRNKFSVAPLDGKEHFAAQGLEGKAIVQKPLRDCLLSTFEIEPYQWRIICDDDYLSSNF